MFLREQLKKQICEVRQNYQRLEQMIPFDILIRENIAVHPKSQELLSYLNNALQGSKNIEKQLRQWVIKRQRALLLLPDDDKRYLEHIIRPRYPDVRRLFIQYHPEGWWEEFLGDPLKTELSTGGSEIANTIKASLNFYDDTVEEGDDRRLDMFDFEGAEAIVESPYFTPDQWRSNAIALRPVTQMERDPLVPPDVRKRLEATYASFVFGNWLACLAMARSTLEYALGVKAKFLELDKYYANSDSDGDLYTLTRRIADHGYMELLEPMDRIRKRGNAVMHDISKGGRSTINPEIALGIVRDLKDCLEKVFVNPDATVE